MKVAPLKRQFLKALEEITRITFKILEITLCINVLKFQRHTAYPLNLKATKYLLLSAKLSSPFIKNENSSFCYSPDTDHTYMHAL